MKKATLYNLFVLSVVMTALIPAQEATNVPKGLQAVELPVFPDIPCSAAPDYQLFEVELSADQENRARRLYEDAVVITAHDHCFHEGDFRDWRKSGITARVLKATVDGIYWQNGKRYEIPVEVDGWFDRTMKVLTFIREHVVTNAAEFRIVRTVDDLLEAKKSGNQGVILALEGARPLEGRLENLKDFYAAGLRELQLYWSVPSPVKNEDGSLSQFGRQVIREMDRLGIVLDLSHMPDNAFWPALAVSQKPVVVSHTSVQALTGKADSLSDERIRAIASRRGAVCLHFFDHYIYARHGSNPTVVDLVDHIDYIRDLVGIEYVALGPDWFPESTYGDWIRGGQSMKDLPNVVREMVRRGYSDRDIQSVLGLNLLRIYGEVWK